MIIPPPVVVYVVVRSYSCEGDDVLGATLDRYEALKMMTKHRSGRQHVDHPVCVYAIADGTNVVQDVTREIEMLGAAAIGAKVIP